MNKSTLAEKWGKYCNTNKLVDNIMALLTKYGHKNTEFGVCTMLDTFFVNKEELIKMLTKSKDYIGDLRIAINSEISKTATLEHRRNFILSFCSIIGAKDAIISTVDSDGKTITDHFLTGKKKISISDIMPNSPLFIKLTNNTEWKNRFDENGRTKNSKFRYRNFVDAVHLFRDEEVTLEASTSFGLSQVVPELKFATGMKTSRAFNRLCEAFSVSRLPKYNSLFAEYADMVSGRKQALKLFISVNPFDYLTMSFGNSWASCHTIDKKNVRNMPNDYSGMYCGGTLSYMLDHVSFITYTHKSIPDDFEQGKIHRCMFHYKDGNLVQGRVYPQGNDYTSDIYTEFRQCVQKTLLDILELKDETWVKSNKTIASVVRTSGVHYEDYLHFTPCNLSYIKSIGPLVEKMSIGHERICPNCGERNYSSAHTETILCQNCGG